ncbi:MAG: transposase, partial [Chitinophagales bacterium]|nr:transposase [Chitinophagales bacterium]
MKQLHFTREQVMKILEDYSIHSGVGLDDLLKLSLESMMRVEREVHNEEQGDVSNGYRIRHTFGRGKQLSLRIPRSRFGQFYPVILGLLRDE